MTFTRPRTRWVTATVVAAAMAFVYAGAAFAQSGRLGATFVAAPANGQVHRFPGVAYDANNDAYLLVWTNIGAIGARFVSGEGALLGAPTQVSTSPFSRAAGAVGVACATPINACLVSWVEETPFQIIARVIRYGGGAVQFLTPPFVVNTTAVLSSSAPEVAYSSASNEFLVTWTGFGAGLDVKAHRVSPSGFSLGAEITIAGSGVHEFFPSIAYNPGQNEFLIAYVFNDTTVVAQRVQPGTGALIGGGTPLYSSGFEGYPEVAYDSRRNRYLVITWHTSSPWVVHGALADGNGNPLTGMLTLASLAGGDGIGLSYSPVTDTFLSLFQSQLNDEVWGAEIASSGVPTSPFQVTVSGTRLAPQPMPAADVNRPRWLTVAPNAFANVMGQFVGVGPVPSAIGSGGGGTAPTPTGGCTSVQPAPDWVCVGGNWLPPSSSPGGGGSNAACPSVQPAPDWVCVGGNWMPPTGGGPVGGNSACPSIQPAPDWVCSSGNWMPPTGGSVGGGNPSCPSVQPGPNWQCLNGNWLPPTPVSGNSSCPSVQPAPDWVCTNGNWLPGAGGGGNASCPSIQPAPNWVCVNGNWLPGAGGGGGNSSCTSIQPAPDWVCSNGNWLPGGGGNSSCTSIQPGPDWVCSNGNWLPGAGGGGANASCLTPQPGPGWLCSNGNWLPGGGPTALTSSCTSVQPAPDWLCSNGNWLPPTLACSSTRPAADWVCQPSTGNWLPSGFGGDD